MWNLARLSCVPSTIDIKNLFIIAHSKPETGSGFIVYGCADEAMCDGIVKTLNMAVGTTAEVFEDGDESFYSIVCTAKESAAFREVLRQGGISVLQRNGIPVGYCMTDGKPTSFMLGVLETRTFES